MENKYWGFCFYFCLVFFVFFEDIDKYRRRFNMRMLVFGRFVKDVILLLVFVERLFYKEKFIFFEFSMWDYFVVKVRGARNVSFMCVCFINFCVSIIEE